VAVTNVFWCGQCDEGYQADEPGCPNCEDAEADAPAPQKDDDADEDGVAALACGASLAVAAAFGTAGFVLGFLVRGCS